MATKLVTVTTDLELLRIAEQLKHVSDKNTEAIEHLTKVKGNLQSERDENELTLNSLLSQGYNIVSSHSINEDYIVFVMYKSEDNDDD